MLRNTYRLFARGYELLARIADDVRSAAKDSRSSVETQAASAKSLEQLQAMVAALKREVRELSQTSRSGLRQYHLQLGRLARAVEQMDADASADATADPQLAVRSIALDPPGEQSLHWAGIGVTHPDPDGREWLQLNACPVCSHGELTLVNPWNKLLLLEQAPDDQSARYDYALCHRCGVVSAQRRPFGARFHFLLEHFGEVTAKRGGGHEIPNPTLNPYPLEPADLERLRDHAAAGIFVSDLSEAGRRRAYLSGLFRDRFESSGHLDIIGALVQPRNARVLEVRAKTGALMDGLRRHWNADVSSMPIWESQQWLVREVYGIPASPLIDFDHFSIPFEGTFDLIVCQHMLTHALRPAEFLGELRRKLNPGGHLYLYNEPDDVEFLSNRQSMIAHLNPLHMQAFDQESLERGLAANGFELVFIKRHEEEHICLARAADVQMRPITAGALQKRIALYQKAHDRSILRLGEALRPRVAEQWPAVVERAVAAGVAEFDEAGQLRLVAL